MKIFYTPPCLEIVSVEIEDGFASSNEQFNPNYGTEKLHDDELYELL